MERETPVHVDAVLKAVDRNMLQHLERLDEEQFARLCQELVQAWWTMKEKNKEKEGTKILAKALCDRCAEMALRKELVVRCWVAVAWLRLYRRGLYWRTAWPRVLRHMGEFGEAYAAVWWMKEWTWQRLHQ